VLVINKLEMLVNRVLQCFILRSFWSHILLKECILH